MAHFLTKHKIIIIICSNTLEHVYSHLALHSDDDLYVKLFLYSPCLDLLPNIDVHKKAEMFFWMFIFSKAQCKTNNTFQNNAISERNMLLTIFCKFGQKLKYWSLLQKTFFNLHELKVLKRV